MIRLDHDRIPNGYDAHAIRRKLINEITKARSRETHENGRQIENTAFFMVPMSDVIGYYKLPGCIIEVARMMRYSPVWKPKGRWLYRVLPMMHDGHVVRHLTKMYDTPREAEAYINSDEFIAAIVLEGMA